MFLLTIKVFRDDEILLAKVTFPIQNSYTDQVQCLSHSRDQKFDH